MAQRSMFFDAVAGDRQYDAASFAALLSAIVQRDGVVYGYGNALAVSAGTGMTVSIGTGVAFVLGRMFEVYGNAETLTIAAADATYPRIDRIVVRLDLSTGVRSVSLAVKKGVAQAVPVAPALTRDVSTWELSLAQVRVDAGATSIAAGKITDERGDATVCGWVYGLLHPTTGHKHTGTDGDGPKLTSSSIGFRGALVYRSTAQSVPSQQSYAMPFNAVAYDTSGFYSSQSPTRLTVPTGVSLVRLQADLQWGASWPETSVLYVARNGSPSPLYPITRSTGNNGGGQNIVSPVLNVSPGDYFEMIVYHSNASAQNTNTNGVWFAIEAVG